MANGFLIILGFFSTDIVFIFELEVVIFGNFFTKHKQAMRWPTE